MPVLQVEGMTHFFGGLRAVHNYSLAIEPGQIRGLIGPNGAGKTTIFNLITGIYKPTEGRVYLDGKPVTGLPAERIAAAGIGRTFQNMRLWRHMTVLEQVKMARYSKLTYGLIGAFFGTPLRYRQEAETEEIAHDLLGRFAVRQYADQIITSLPYGAQRRVEMARAVAMDPKVLLLDEPTAGMNPEELAQMMNIIAQVNREFGLAIMLIEHRMRVVMDLCQTIQTLVFGEVIFEGTPEETRANPAVIEAYLGKEVAS